MVRKNIVKIPKAILERIKTFGQDDVIAACVRLIRHDEIAKYAPLGLSVVGGAVVAPAPFLPNPLAGKFSLANVEGLERKRRDLPKVSKTFSVEAPSWHGSGTHTVLFSRLVYPIDFFPPKEVTLSVVVVQQHGEAASVRFAIDEVINRRTPHFERALFHNLNILQENVGAFDVFISSTTSAEYAQTVRVGWELLPAGTGIDQVLAAFLKSRPVDPQAESVMRARIAVMRGLSPEQYVIGTTGFAKYFGAKFGDDFVVFESERYANAIYIMRENWASLSRKSRTELLAGPFDEITRIEHRAGWEDKLRREVSAYRKLNSARLV